MIFFFVVSFSGLGIRMMLVSCENVHVHTCGGQRTTLGVGYFLPPDVCLPSNSVFGLGRKHQIKSGCKQKYRSSQTK